jgi:integrase/recombinase XerD
MTPLTQALEDYLRIRRGLGFNLKADQRLLEDFVGFLQRAKAERITTELALKWARLPVNTHPHRWRQRLGIVRGFARHVATLDPSSEVPSKDLLPARRQRVAPYIYSSAEIAALMQAAGALTPPLRAAAIRTVIGLMATTGLRLGEALWLDCADVDLTDGALHVRAHQHKQREVPTHPTTTRALRDYARLRDDRWRNFPSPAFFLNTRGGRLAKWEFNHQFAKLIRRIGLEGAGERVRPRPHDLRHTMAVRTLLDWHEAGEDVDRRMPELSTLLGHADPVSTYW